MSGTVPSSIIGFWVWRMFKADFDSQDVFSEGTLLLPSNLTVALYKSVLLWLSTLMALSSWVLGGSLPQDSSPDGQHFV
jgi:hypothetical protein